MTNLKEFKQHNSEINWTVIDVLENVDISKTNKFLPLFINLINKNKEKFESQNFYNSEDERYINDKFGESSGHSKYISHLKYSLVNHLFDGWANIEMIEKFMSYHQKNAMPNVDINQIKSFSEIYNLVGLCEIKNNDKQFSKMVIKHYETDEWMLVRPLTWAASKKYGSGSKWCTTQSHNPRYFYEYSENAALIYCINLNTGYKVALHEPINQHSNKRFFNFWNSEDEKIDSMSTELPIEILNFIKNMEPRSNKELSGGIWDKSYYRDRDEFENSIGVEIGVPTPQATNDDVDVIDIIDRLPQPQP